MIKLLIGSPFFLIFLGAIGLIYIFVLFHFAGRDEKLSVNLEKFLVLMFIFISSGTSGLSMVPFNRLNFNNLSDVNTGMPYLIVGIGFYGTSLFLLSSRFRHTLKDSIYVSSVLINKDPFLCLLLLMAALSACWSETPDFTIRRTAIVLITSIVAIYIGKNFSWKDLFFFLRWSCLLGLAFSLLKSNPDLDGKWAGIYYHKNGFSYFMAQAIIWWLLQVVYVPKYRRRAIVVTLLAFLGLQKGGSGGSKVIVVILLGLWGYIGVLKKMKPRWAFLSVVLFLIVSIFLTIWVSENLESIIVGTLNKDMTLSGRTEFWPILWEKILENPWLGYGVGGFWQAWRGIYNPAADVVVAKTGFRPAFAHNGFLELGLILGITGLFLFFASFFNNLAKAVQHLSETKQPVAGLPLLLLTYTLISNISESNLFGASSVWLWYVAISVRLSLDSTGNFFNEQSRVQRDSSTAMLTPR